MLRPICLLYVILYVSITFYSASNANYISLKVFYILMFIYFFSK
jgi:hypothetical protein